MSDLIPRPGRPSRAVVRAAHAAEQTETAIYEHQLIAEYETQIDQIDSRAIGEAVAAAMKEEIRVLDEGLALAGDSLAKKELVSRLIAIQSRADSARIARHFGG